MPAIRFDPELRFTCGQCGRCCRRGEVVLTQGELEAYRRVGAGRWFREEEGRAEGAVSDPFVPVPGHPGHFQIRKREDRACGFLSPANLCRIHEELGSARKPLTCRLFPFRFHPAEGGAVSASFTCPTVAQGGGLPLADQARELAAVAKEWAREFPEPALAVRMNGGRPAAPEAVATLRGVLRRLLDAPGPDGRPDLGVNLGRMARLVDDLSRLRVQRLAPDRLAEYLRLTGEFAVQSPRSAPGPGALARLMARGLLFVALAFRLQRADPAKGLRLGLRLRLARLVAHFHGLGSGPAGIDLGKAARVSVDLSDPLLHPIAYNYLRAAIETLGTGRRPALDELAVSAALLNAARSLAALRAAARGSATAEAADLVEGLVEASDLSHAAEGGFLSGLLGTLSAGPEAFLLFSASSASRR